MWSPTTTITDKPSAVSTFFRRYGGGGGVGGTEEAAAAAVPLAAEDSSESSSRRRTTATIGWWRRVRLDIQSFSTAQRALMTAFALMMIVFSFIDFNWMVDPSSRSSVFTWENDASNGVALWKRVIQVFSGVASFSGAMSVVLTAKGKLSAYYWGILNTITYGLLAFTYGYSGDAQLNIFFFLPMQFWGIYSWSRRLDGGETVIPRGMSPLGYLAAAAACAALAIAFYYEIPAFSRALVGSYAYEDMPLPWILDASTNALNIVAMVLSIQRFWEQWILWISVDVLQIAMYAGVAGFGVNINIVAMWSFFLVNALCGLYIWFRRYRTARRCQGGDGSKLQLSTKSPGHDEICSLSASSSPQAAGNCYSSTSSPHNCPTTASLPQQPPPPPHASTFSLPGAVKIDISEGAGGGAIDRQVAVKKEEEEERQRRVVRPRTGLIIGKFYPFHLGHKHLIDSARQHLRQQQQQEHVAVAVEVTDAPPPPSSRALDLLTVIVCHKPHELPSGSTRLTAIRETYADATDAACEGRGGSDEDKLARVELLLKEDVYDPDDSELWATLARRWLGYTPEFVFTSEDYGQRWADFLGSRHVLVDRERTAVPISGTRLRAAPYANWRFLPPASRHFYKRRVVLVGPESTGKSTLAAALGRRFGCPVVEEYGREYTEMKIAGGGARRATVASSAAAAKDEAGAAAAAQGVKEEAEEEAASVSVDWSDEDFIAIATRQEEDIKRALRSTSAPLVICDTDAFATQVWYDRYMHEAEMLRRRGNSRGGGAAGAQGGGGGSGSCCDSVFAGWRVVPDGGAKGETHLYILCDTSVAFVQDGTRDGEHIRSAMFEEFRRRLLPEKEEEEEKEQQKHHQVAIVTGSDYGDRLEQAAAAVSKLCPSLLLHPQGRT